MFSRRLNVLLCAFLLAGGVLLARLGQIQLGRHHLFNREEYERAGGSHLVETVRGGIYTRWGTPLAVQVPSFDLGVYYDKLDEGDWKQTLAALCGTTVEAVTAEAEDIIERVERIEARVQAFHERDDLVVAERFQYHRVVENVPPEVAALVRSEPDLFPTARIGRRGHVPTVQVLERSRRRYPNGSLAPHVVGQMVKLSRKMWDEKVDQGRAWWLGMPFSRIEGRYTMDERAGVSGMEKAREDLLRGTRGYVLNRLAFGVLKVEKVSLETPPESGCDVYLTVREDFQRAANAALALAAATEELEFKSGALVILDVHSGAVLAAATYPSFDLAAYDKDDAKPAADPPSPISYFFRPVQAALPSGSVYKVITAIAALEEGAITPATTFTCRMEQTFRAGRASRKFHCTSAHGTLSLVPAIEKSCNIYFYNTARAAGGDALARWGRRFGLGTPTGVDLPYERSGSLPDPRGLFGALNLCIGQGELTCTPLQVANMMAAIANGGKLYRPHFFDHAKDARGEIVRSYEPQFEQIPLKEGVLEAVREGMRLAVERGTARPEVLARVTTLRDGLEPYRAAGKTGTAEIAGTALNHAWFAGYAPCDDPKIAFAAVSERTPGHGGSHAAPIVAFALEDIWDQVEHMP